MFVLRYNIATRFGYLAGVVLVVYKRQKDRISRCNQCSVIVGICLCIPIFSISSVKMKRESITLIIARSVHVICIQGVYK